MFSPVYMKKRGDFLQRTPSNKSYCFAAYKQFTWLVYKILGKGNLQLIPSCVLWKTRETFPEEDGFIFLKQNNEIASMMTLYIQIEKTLYEYKIK